MSLLLDALKKAAEDKQKSSADAEDKELPNTEAAQDEELELELDEFEVPDDDPEQNDSPLIIEDRHDSAVTDNSTLEELPELTQDLPPVVEPQKSSLTDRPQQAAPGDSSADNVATPATVDAASEHSQPEEAPVEDSKQSAPAESPAVESAPAPAAEPQPEPEPVKVRQPAVSSREALDMMINKSRVATDRRDKTVRNIGLIVFVLLLGLGGSYFYFDAQQKISDLQRTDRRINAPQSNTPVAETKTVIVREPEVQPAQPVQANRVAAPVRKTVPAKPVSKPATKTLQITHKTVQDPIDMLLSRAYEKFIAAEYDGANRLYLQVLEREPRNRDGLLGTAAVAMKQQRYEYARQKYQSLLVLDPKDSMARAGISAIESDASSESRLKSMLREQPEAAHLYFALGSLFAGQSRWPEAQQAFFSAWSGDPNNADYAYNLGISLDQLGKYPQALSIYQTTLKLARSKQVEFSTDDVQARIDQLGKLNNE